MVAVAGKHESAGDDMMCEHLPMILASFFDIDNKDLLQPECKLGEVVPFEQTIHFPIRPVCP